jgi:hypothetical protein
VDKKYLPQSSIKEGKTKGAKYSSLQERSQQQERDK